MSTQLMKAHASVLIAVLCAPALLFPQSQTNPSADGSKTGAAKQSGGNTPTGKTGEGSGSSEGGNKPGSDAGMPSATGLKSAGAHARDSGEPLWVVVLSFDDATVRLTANLLFRDPTLGKAIAVRIRNQLDRDLNYLLIPATEVERAMQEQDLTASNLNAPSGLAKLGRQLGADLIIDVSVVKFGPEDRGSSGQDLEALRSVTGKIVVEWTARVFDGRTGVLLASFTAQGESQRFGLSPPFSGIAGRSDRQRFAVQALQDGVAKTVVQLEADAAMLRIKTGQLTTTPASH